MFNADCAKRKLGQEEEGGWGRFLVNYFNRLQTKVAWGREKFSLTAGWKKLKTKMRDLHAFRFAFRLEKLWGIWFFSFFQVELMYVLMQSFVWVCLCTCACAACEKEFLMIIDKIWFVLVCFWMDGKSEQTSTVHRIKLESTFKHV